MTTRSSGDKRGRAGGFSSWGLRRKVAAMTVLPITVAAVLGGVGIADRLATASRFAMAADQTAVIVPLLDMNTASGVYAAKLLRRQATDEDLTQLDDAIRALRNTLDDPSIEPELAAAVTPLIDSTEEIRRRPGIPSLEALGADLNSIQDEAAQIVAGVVAATGDAAILEQGALLVDAWTAQQRLFGQTLAIIERQMDPTVPETALVAALGAEEAMLDMVARRLPADDLALSGLRRALQEREASIAEAPARGPANSATYQTMWDSQQIYTPLIESTAESIMATAAAQSNALRSSALRTAAIVSLALVVTIVLGVLVARSLLIPIRRLRRATLAVTNEHLPAAIDRIKVGDASAIDDFEPIPVRTSEEIGQLARAVDDMHGQALRLAGEQAQLRLQVGEMFETLARRSKSLVDQQLGLIETLEFEEKDPKRLESLFRLDHIAARMRRNGDNLLILSGHRAHRAESQPVQLGDVVRAAMSEVEDYQRVQLGATPTGALAGAVAADVAHLVAELLDNALHASPPGSPVPITFARAVDGGVILEIADSGIGIPGEHLRSINDRLAAGGEVSPETARHMGLFVVSRLAERHGLTVRLRRTHDSRSNPGVTAAVHIPGNLLVSPVEMPNTGALPRVDLGGTRPDTVTPSASPPPPAPAARETPASEQFGTGLPQRTPGATGLPQRTPGATGLPQRTPGATVNTVAPPQEPTTSGRTSLPPVASPEPNRTGDDPLARPVRRHRYLTNASKTVSFLQARSNASTLGDAAPGGTPIFSGMVSDWLADPTELDDIGKFEWASAADAGWTAAQRAADTPVESRTESGLPRRSPGHRLVPGSVGAGAETPAATRLRDPAVVRETLSRHQRGIRDGRAAGSTRYPSTGGDA